MSSSASSSKTKLTPDFIRYNDVLMLKASCSENFHVSCFQAVTLDVNEIFHCVNGPRFGSAIKRLVCIAVKAEIRSKE